MQQAGKYSLLIGWHKSILISDWLNRESETSIMIDRALEHQNKLQNTNRYMDDLLGQGSSILENLREQRSTLKTAQKKMLDVLNTLGMSNTVIRLILNSHWLTQTTSTSDWLTQSILISDWLTQEYLPLIGCSRLIERRSEGDKYILIGGMLVTCLFMWLILRMFS